MLWGGGMFWAVCTVIAAGLRALFVCVPASRELNLSLPEDDGLVQATASGKLSTPDVCFEYYASICLSVSHFVTDLCSLLVHVHIRNISSKQKYFKSIFFCIHWIYIICNAAYKLQANWSKYTFSNTAHRRRKAIYLSGHFGRTVNLQYTSLASTWL